MTDDAATTADARYEPIAPFGEWAALHVNVQAWHTTASRLHSMREHADQEVFRLVIQEVTRAAAIDTGAIEGLYDTDRGFTETMAKEHAFIEAITAERGEEVGELVAAQLEGFEMVLDAATGCTQVHAAWLRTLHATITRAQATYRVRTPEGLVADLPLPHGQYKTASNHVRLSSGEVFPYAPVAETPHEVERLVAELARDDFAAAPAPLQSAYAHYAFIRIHPFADGNGRVARALASLYLYRAASVPFLLFASDRGRYLTALRAADGGDTQAFVTFVEGRAIETVQLATDQLQAASEGDLRALTAALSNLVTAQGGLTRPEIDAITARVAEEFTTQIAALVGEIDLPQGVTVQQESTQLGHPEPEGFRILLSSTVRTPIAVNKALVVDVFGSSDRSARELVWLRGGGPPQSLEVGLALDDVYPELSATARMRIHTLARTVVTRVVRHLVRHLGG